MTSETPRTEKQQELIVNEFSEAQIERAFKTHNSEMDMNYVYFRAGVISERKRASVLIDALKKFTQSYTSKNKKKDAREALQKYFSSWVG